MTALIPDHQGTGPLFTAPVLVASTVPETARRRATAPASEVPAWTQLAAAIVATSHAWFAADLILAGWRWAAAAPAVLAIAIFGGAVLPDVLAARWDRAHTNQMEDH